MAIVYSDYAAEEIAIAAWLSRDPNLLEAMRSGDPYVWFLKAIGMIPPNAARRDHERLRDWVKPFLLGIHYGLTVIGVAARLNVSLEEADRYLGMHQRLFPTYWKWSADHVDIACERRAMQSRWGWRLQIPGGEDRSSRRDIKRSLKNHPIQTMGAHILHFAEIGLTESGICVCCPVHDAVLWESPLDRVDADVVKVDQIMRLAAKSALGVEIPADHKIVRHAEDADVRYMDKRGRKMFERATAALKDIEVMMQVRGDIGRGSRVIRDIPGIVLGSGTNKRIFNGN
jgi:DNA polymerase I-like protein with 3'-5' exonuclease and polymerase domains